MKERHVREFHWLKTDICLARAASLGSCLLALLAVLVVLVVLSVATPLGQLLLGLGLAPLGFG